jgi:hypothetical protein
MKLLNDFQSTLKKEAMMFQKKTSNIAAHALRLPLPNAHYSIP